MVENVTIKAVRLNPGDKIGIISPASPPFGSKKQLFFKGLEYLRDRGYNCVQGDHLFCEHGYLAGTDEQRLSDLNRFIQDPTIRAIFCSRGGYGTARLIRDLDYETLKKDPKVLVGYSDITTLQLAIFAQTGLISFSGPMVAVEMGKTIDPFTETHFWPMVMQSTPHSLSCETSKIRNQGVAEGRLLGGCLSLVTHSVGTPFFPDMEGAILFLEDIGEAPYKIDRYLAQLRNAGVLDQIQGLILGDFLHCTEDAPTLEIEQILHDYVDHLNIPVIDRFPYGHGDIKFTLPVGCRVRLDTHTQTLEMLESGVCDG